MIDRIAVLTGDLIGSTRESPDRVASTMDLLAALAGDIGENCRFARYRGDGWQMAMPDAEHSIWACLYILARLRADPDTLLTRIAIGIGVQYSDNATGLAAAYGPAFTFSGRALDGMARGQILAMAADRGENDDFRALALAFIEDYVQRWTEEQAEAVALALHPDGPTQEDIARRLGISRQAVGARLRAAGYGLLDKAQLAFFRALTPPESPAR